MIAEQTPSPLVANPRPASVKRRSTSRQIILFILLMGAIFGSMTLLPYAILYFIDPLIADTFMTYSFPYMLIPMLIVMVVLSIVFIVSAVVKRRSLDDTAYAQLQMPAGINIGQMEPVHEAARVRCDYCGTLNPETASKCESCGANL